MKKFHRLNMMQTLLISLLAVALLPILILLCFNIFELSREEYDQKLGYLNEAAYDMLDNYNTRKESIGRTVQNLVTIIKELEYIEPENNQQLKVLLEELKNTSTLDFLIIMDENKNVIARTDFESFGDKIDLPIEAEPIFQGKTLVSLQNLHFEHIKTLTKGLLKDQEEKTLTSELDKDLLELKKGLFLMAGSPIYKEINREQKLEGILIIGKYLDKDYFNVKKHAQWPPEIDVDFLPEGVSIQAEEENVVSIPIYDISNNHIANIIVWFDPEKTSQLLTRSEKATIVVFVLTIIISIVVAFMIARLLVSPIKVLNNSVKQVIDDQYDHQVAIQGPLEIEELCDAFNKMIISLEEKRRMQKDFIATLTHDLRVPLYAEEKVLNLFLTEKKYQQFENQKKLLEGMVKSNSDLIQLINTLLDTFKLEEGRYKLNIDNHDLTKIFNESINALKVMAQEKQISVNFTPQESEIIAKIDASEIKRVIMNLLSNAIKFTSTDGTVEINLYKENDSVHFSIKDNGIGMSEEEKTRIFTRYNSNAKKLKMIGTGLGLYLSYCIIIQHKGQITVESEKDKGSIFFVTLPVNFEED